MEVGRSDTDARWTLVRHTTSPEIRIEEIFDLQPDCDSGSSLRDLCVAVAARIDMLAAREAQATACRSAGMTVDNTVAYLEVTLVVPG